MTMDLGTLPTLDLILLAGLILAWLIAGWLSEHPPQSLP